jgi:WD40 repeat protein
MIFQSGGGGPTNAYEALIKNWLTDFTNPLTAVAYSSDGRYLATGDDAAATVWDAETFEELRALPSYHVNGVAFGPDGLLVSASDDGTATVWDVRSGTAIATLSGHTGSVEHVSISPDGTRVATAGHEGTAKVWDAADGRRLFTLFSHNGPVWSTAFSPDGRRIVTASNDGTAQVRDLRTGRVAVRARVTYRPLGGAPRTKGKRVVLVKL